MIFIEIVYGFGVNVRNEEVVENIYVVKGCLFDNLLIVYIYSIE